MSRYKIFVYAGMILIALGANFLTTWYEKLGSFGAMTIAIGVLCFIIGMRLKREDDKKLKK